MIAAMFVLGMIVGALIETAAIVYLLWRLL